MTTIVETYGSEALAEILSILSERGRRSSRSFLIGTDSIKRILRQRFGISRHESGLMLCHLEKILIKNNVFKIWDTKQKGSSGHRPVVIYWVDVLTLDKYP